MCRTAQKKISEWNGSDRQKGEGKIWKERSRQLRLKALSLLKLETRN